MKWIKARIDFIFLNEYYHFFYYCKLIQTNCWYSNVNYNLDMKLVVKIYFLLDGYNHFALTTSILCFYF